MTASYLRKGQGKSDNAYYAQREGKWPLTRAVQVIYDKIKPYYKITKKEIRKWLESLGSCEWHHVGKYATECDYYDTTSIIDALFGVDRGYMDTNVKGDPIYWYNNEFLEKCDDKWI